MYNFAENAENAMNDVDEVLTALFVICLHCDPKK